jgi:hypothetical protein
MKNIEITRQKAVSILQKDLKDGTLGPVDKAMYEVIQPYKKLQKGEEVILRKGSKLKIYDKKYYICVYAQDGQDVDYYFQKRK